MPPETKYAQSPSGAIGYQVFGDGPVDVVFVTQWATNIDNYWDEPTATRYLDRLASFSRVIIFDKRGTGISDPVPLDNMPPMELWMEDILTVMDAAESERAVIVGDTEGGAMAILFAATYPERTRSLVLINAIARLFRGPEYPIGMPQHMQEASADFFLAQHGTTGAVIDVTAPSVAGDQRFRHWWVKFQRSAMPPGMLEFGYGWLQRIDVTAALPLVTVPTLVIHRRENVYHRVAFGKWIADRISGAQWVELDGADSHPFHVGNYSEILDRVEDFVTGEVISTESDQSPGDRACSPTSLDPRNGPQNSVMWLGSTCSKPRIGSVSDRSNDSAGPESGAPVTGTWRSSTAPAKACGDRPRNPRRSRRPGHSHARRPSHR